MATPKVTRTLFDQNLDRSVPQGPQNRSVVLLGTGTDGPMYEPTKVNSPAEAEDIFGSFGSGTLTRGIKECFDAQVGGTAAANVWGMRVGGIKAERSLLTMYGCSGGGHATAAACLAGGKTWDVVMTVEALYEGSVYNGMYFSKQTDTEGEFLYFWNPKTQLFSKFALTGTDGLDVTSLVAAINSDPNTNSVVFASEEIYDVEGQEYIMGDTGGELTISGNTASISLTAAEANWADVSPIKEISSFYSVSSSEQVTIDANAGDFKPDSGFIADGFANDSFSTIVDGDSVDAGASEVYFVLNEGMVDASSASTSITLAGSGSSTMEIELATPMDSVNGVLTGADITVSSVDNAGLSYSDNGIQLTLGGTVELPTVTYTLDHDIILNALSLAVGDKVTVSASFNTADSTTTMTQVANDTLPVGVTQFRLLNDGTMQFGAALPYAMVLRYAKLKYYEEGSTYFVESTDTGVINIIDQSMINNIGSGHILIGIDYEYVHDDAYWGTNSWYLEGGANGTLMTNGELKADLNSAYEHFVADEFDIMSVVDLSVDASMTDSASGDLIPAGFAEQMSDFLDTFNGEMIGVIGFEPLEGKGVGGRVLRSDIAERVKDLTSPDLSGTSSAIRKAATILSDFHQPFMYAVDIEGIYSANGIRYTASAASSVAGLMAKMPTEEAIFRFNLPGVQGMRYRYTETDQATGMRQVDLLADARIATGILQDGGVKITESRSLASSGSDFENLMTVLILQETLQICREVAKGFIGKVSSQALLQAFQSTLDKSIGDALVPRALRGFKAPITMTPGERVLGKITIPLTLSPQFEIRDVHYNVQLTAEDIA